MSGREAAEAHQGSLSAEQRRSGGVYYTPDHLIDWVLDHSLTPLLAQTADPRSLRICDPSCGAGLFLIAAARRLVQAGLSRREAEECLAGVDLDERAVALAREVLPGADLRVGDGLLEERVFDLVIGNPPFLNQLSKHTAMSREDAARVRTALGRAVGAYTDVSAIFLARALQQVRGGGRVAMVQPLSLLAARDAAPIREFVQTHGVLEDIWATPEQHFEDASVMTCVVSIRKAVGAGGGDSWAPRVAESFGIPAVSLATHGVLGDIGEATADFRDQYYGLAPFVREDGDGGDGFRLITSGLIEPGLSMWGSRETRFQKRRWRRPVISRDVLDSSLADWARRRLVPKVLIGTQGRVIEAVVDEQGEWLPSVPVITVTTTRPWHVLAVLLSPPVVAHAAATYLGTALSARAIKLSARQVEALPLPENRALWDRGAELARAGQLHDCARTMTAAYDVDEAIFEWWVDRAGC